MNAENNYKETDLGNVAPNPRGEFSEAEEYEYLDYVYYQGGSYLCLAELGTTIVGFAPEAGKTTKYWQAVALPGGLTPEYVAMHDKVVNLSEQVSADTEEVRESKENIEGMETNVENLQDQSEQSAQEAEESKTQAAGYASAAEASRQAAETSEQNINAQVTGFDTHVAEKTESAESDIEAARIAANAAVVAQQESSVQEVKNKTSQYITEKQSEAEQAIETKAQEYATSVDEDIQTVNNAGTTQVGNVNSSGDAQVQNIKNAGAAEREAAIKAVQDEGAAQKQAVTDEGALQVQAVENKGQEVLESIPEDYTALQAQADGNTEAVKDLSDKKITKFYASNLGETTLNDSDNGKIQDMKIFGKSYQYQGDMELEDGTTVTVPNPEYPQEIQSVVNPVVKVCGKNLLDTSKSILGHGKAEIINGEIYLNGIYDSVFDYYLFDTNNEALESIKKINKIVTISCGSFNVGIWKKTGPITGSKIKINPFAEKLISIFVTIPSGTYENVKVPIMVEVGEDATEYEPYTEHLATLPYTLNAIPVDGDGNVTIDGQEYVADYVDVERGKLVRCVGEVDLGTLNWVYGNYTISTWHAELTTPNFLAEKYSRADWGNINYGEIAYNGNVSKIIVNTNSSVEKPSGKIAYELSTPIEVDLTPEEVQMFRDLSTHYPTTNIFVTSDQLDGYTEFNYPVSLAEGWNYVKQQLGDTRDFIYDAEVKLLETSIDTAILTAMMEG